MNSERTVVVTGFGPFANHEVNASWEAVKELYNLRDNLRERYNVNLVIDHIPVAYDPVFEKVPQLWNQYDPKLVLHVGVSHKAKCLTIERRAHGDGYVRKDVNARCPSNRCERSADAIETKVDVKQLCRKINDNTENECEACVSHDAGRYLCEYIYYQSLCRDPERALFVHVPDIGIYSSELTAKGLYDIIVFLVAEKSADSLSVSSADSTGINQRLL